ncbi:CHAT domain-containing protein [Mesorhizobium sp. BR1-1-16]|uniref:CHAT domain-containing protein n=1 Tax=Mesorhizobium sp. BR1-1-16 TaxID=2876653 RepID=UPI001CCD6D99|nr:CHAT domain-containing protein [Mesorhizobium sp. BR1-1-16]MBZ9938976.1 CHAT domain-containing protein [Mesorhizobium sp. BR1-1-16]
MQGIHKKRRGTDVLESLFFQMSNMWCYEIGHRMKITNYFILSSLVAGGLSVVTGLHRDWSMGISFAAVGLFAARSHLSAVDVFAALSRLRWKNDKNSPHIEALTDRTPTAGKLEVADETANDTSHEDRAAELLGDLALAPSLEGDRPAIMAIVMRQIVDGLEKASRSYWSTTDDQGVAYNVGNDILAAAGLAIFVMRQCAGSNAAIRERKELLEGLAGAIARARNDFKILVPDRDGFGSATMGEICRDLLALAGSELTSLDYPEIGMIERRGDVRTLLERLEFETARDLSDARIHLPVFAPDVPSIASDHTRKTIGTFRRLLANELWNVPTSEHSGKNVQASIARLRTSGQVFAAEHEVLIGLEEIFPESISLDAEIAESRSITDRIIALGIKVGHRPNTSTLRNLRDIVERAVDNPLYRSSWAEKSVNPNALCPIGAYVTYVERFFRDDIHEKIHSYSRLILLRDGLSLHREILIDRINNLDKGTLYLDYFVVIDECDRAFSGIARANYIGVSYRGGDPASIRLTKCLSEKNENDREIADLRGHLTGLGEVEARAGGIMPVLKVAIGVAEWSKEDFLLLKGLRVFGSLARELGIVTNAGIERLVIRPAGDIGRVSFEALPMGDIVRLTLGDCFAIRYVPFSPLMDEAGPRNAEHSHGAMVAGAFDYDATGIGRSTKVLIPGRTSLFEPLGGAEQEIERVAGHLRVSPLRDPTRESIRAAAEGGVSVLHLATHAYSVDRQFHQGSALGGMSETEMLPRHRKISFGGIVLSGANSHIDNNGWFHSERMLESSDIETWNLTRVALVTLSACESALGVVELDGIGYGLRDAFLRAGAACIVSSLWAVDDHATAKFMDRFYAEFARGLPVSAALLAARRASRKDIGLDRFAFVALGREVSWEDADA